MWACTGITQYFVQIGSLRAEDQLGEVPDYKTKSNPTHETAPFFLYYPIKTATHSLAVINSTMIVLILYSLRLLRGGSP